MNEHYEAYLRYELGRSPHTIEAYLRDLHEYADFITNGHIDRFDATTVATADVRIWLTSLSTCGRSAVTIKRKLQSLRAFFFFCLRRGLIKADPTAPIEMAIRRRELPRCVPETKMEQILQTGAQAPDADSEWALRDRLIITLLYTTGIRRAELLALKDSDVNRARREIRVLGKGNKERTLPLAESICELLDAYLATRECSSACSTLFRHRGRPLSATRLAQIVRQQLAGSGTDRPTPHTLRHTFATTMLNHGAEINTVQAFLGHVSLETTQIYTHVTFADMKRAYSHAHPRAEASRTDKPTTPPDKT